MVPRYLWCCARESGRLGSYIEVGINWEGVGMPAEGGGVSSH